MKNTLLALALFAFAGSSAFAQDGAKKAVASTTPKAKSGCSMSAKGSMAGSGSACCMKGSKTASMKPAVKAPAVVKL